MSDADYVQDLPQAERIALASKFVLQAPPGEIGEVLNDVKLILNDQEAFEQVLRDALPQYHQEQSTVVDLPGQAYKTVVSGAAKVPAAEGASLRYYDPRGGQTFELDHVTLAASSLEPLELPSETTSYLATFTTPLDAYIANHFTTGGGAVFPHLKLGVAPVPAAPVEPPVPASTPATTEESAEATSSDVPPPAPDADAVESSEAAQETTEDAAEDKAVETALVETAEEVAAVAKEVEEELTLVKEDGDAPAPAAVEAAESAPAAEGASESEDIKTALAEDVERTGDGDETPAVDSAASMDGVTEEVPAPAAPAEETPTTVAPVPAAEEEAAVAPPPAAPAVEFEEGKYTVVLSGHRYSPTNFWSGRWRSSYVVDQAAETVQGRIEVVVHYYEQGNVQLHSVDTPSFALPPAGDKQAQAIVDEISKLEKAAQEGVNERLEQLGDKAFKSLRRALPVTRQKVEWEKISGYKLGGAIGGGKSRPEEEADL